MHSVTWELPRSDFYRAALTPCVLVLLAAANGAMPVLALAQPAAQAVAQGSGELAGERPGPQLDSAVQALSEFNRGAALMEQYEYAAAAKAFGAVLKKMPNWTAARFNFGLAHLNQDTAEGLALAVKAFQAVLAAEPGNPHALFCLGMYCQHTGDNDRAMSYFARVYWADPADPHVAFKYAETLIAADRHAEAIKVLERVVALDPGFISGVYRLAMLYRRTAVEKAIPLLKRFKDLNSAEVAGGAFMVQKVYGTAGKYYEVLGADNHPLVRKPLNTTRRIIFSPEVDEIAQTTHAWDWKGGSVAMPGLAVADVDQDGDLDLFLTATRPGGSGAIWLNDGTGGFTAAQTIDLRCVSASFGDVDNDGDDDLWLGCDGADQLWQNDGKGVFSLGDFSGDGAADSLTPLSRLIDIDSDGDLDLLAFRLKAGTVPAGAEGEAAASSVYNNNRDGAFPDVASKLGLELADLPVAAVVCDDLDNDRDLDLVLFPVGARAPVVWVNDRLGVFRKLDPSKLGLNCSEVISATTGDPDKDGDRDLLVCTKGSTQLFENVGRFQFRLQETFTRRHGGLRATGGQFVDMDNDGDLDLIMGDAHRRDGTRGPALLVNNWPQQEFVNVVDHDPGNLLSEIKCQGDASSVAADFTGNGRCDLLVAAAGGKPLLIRNVTPGGHFLELDLRGTTGRDQMTRSNNSAIGARVEIKTGGVYQQLVVGGVAGPVAAVPLRVHAGLGENPKVDWLRIVWPDAVLQAELEIAGDRVAPLTELSRKTSSCPYLFAWNGTRYEFVGDFGGVGGLGYLVAPGIYAPPDPTEYVRLPNLVPRDGFLVLNALTVLEEVTYFDEAKLVAIDHPADTEVLPNEMMAINAAPPDYEVFCFRQPIEPQHACDHRGVDVTANLARVDRRYAGATQKDVRFAGLAEPHFVELDFGNRLAQISSDARLIFVAHGWVEYGYSATNYAAAQAGLRTEAPSIEVLRDGEWIEVFDEVGYPAGTQHVMTLDVTGKILPSDRAIRISSNMELYWDRIYLAEHQGSERLTQKVVPAASADLHYFGYPREYSPDGRHPNLSDYENVDRSITWKLMSGDYTRYGEVAELVQQADDCFVIMGRGEELTLKFPVAELGPVPSGQRRTFLLKADSFCKDMDLYTAFPDTVEPLPFHAMSGYPYGPDEHYPDDAKRSQYRREFNTRHVRVE